MYQPGLVLLLSLAHAAALAQDGRLCATCPSYNESLDRALHNERVHSSGIQEATHPPTATFYPLPYWTQGTLRPYAGVASRAWLLYNAHHQQLVRRSAAGGPETVNTDELQEFSVGDSLLGTHRLYRRYLSARLANPALRTAFFEVRHDAGRAALVCQRAVYEYAHMKNGKRRNPEKLEETVRYFIKDTGNNIVAVGSLRPEAVLAALGTAHGAALAAYARQQRLELSRERDVIRLLTYYDTL